MCDGSGREPLFNDGNALRAALIGYLQECRESDSEGDAGSGANVKAGRKKPSSRFANLAGFCRYCGTGEEELIAAAKKFPAEYGFVRSALEDEALNSERSPALLSAYLKQKLGYGERGGQDKTDNGQLTLLFEHNAYEDGE